MSYSQQGNNPEPFCETSGSGKNHIIFVHGFGLNRRSWYDVAPKLADTSTLHMVDLIGFGDSPAPEKWPYTIEAQAETLLEFIVEKKLSDVVLVGHSYGGGVVLILLNKMIEKGNSSFVKKLVLIAPAAYPQALPFFITIPRIPVIGEAFLAWVGAEFQIRTTMRKVFRNKVAVTDERVKRYVGNISRPSYRNALIRTARNIIPQNADKLVNEIEKIQHKALLIYGENDPVISRENLERLSETLPAVITKKIKFCGHVPHEEFPYLTAGLISEFLGSGGL